MDSDIITLGVLPTFLDGVKEDTKKKINDHVQPATQVEFTDKKTLSEYRNDIDAKVEVFVQADEPTTAKTNDLWEQLY